MLLNTTRLCNLVSILLSLMFTRIHMFTGNLERVQSFCCKVATQLLVVVEYVRGIPERKSCKYSKYGSFVHLLFLLVASFTFRFLSVACGSVLVKRWMMQ